MDILEKYRVVQQSLTTTVNLGTIVSNGGIGALKPGLDYFRFVLGTYDESDTSDTFAKDVTISNNHDWDYLYDPQNDYNKAYIYGDTSNMYYPFNVLVSSIGVPTELQQTKNKFLNNFYYCIGTMDFTKKTESELTDTEVSYINSKYAWKKFNGTLKVPLGTEYKTYVWMIGSNVWGETNYEGYTEEACDDFDMPVIGNFSINSERINFCTTGTNVQDVVDVQGAYGSLYWGTYSDYWYKCPNFNIGNGSKDHGSWLGPRVTFKGCKLKNADGLFLFNDSQPYCYSGLFDGSTIESGPAIGTGAISGNGRISLDEYSCSQMFKSCKRLKNYTFDNRINISGKSCLQGTFENCTALTTVNIPMMIYNGSNAGSDGPLGDLGGGFNRDTMKDCFKNCSNLTKVELNLSPHGNKPTWWDYEWTNYFWVHQGYGLTAENNTFTNAGPLSKINILNVKNVDNAIQKSISDTTYDKYIMYNYGDPLSTDSYGNAGMIYTLLNSHTFYNTFSFPNLGDYYTDIYDSEKNIYIKIKDGNRSGGTENNNWKLQINGNDYISNIRIPKIAYSIDPTNYNKLFSNYSSTSKDYIKFSLRFSNSLASSYVTFTVPKGMTWAEAVNAKFGPNNNGNKPLINIIHYNLPGSDNESIGIHLLASNSLSADKPVKTLIGFYGYSYYSPNSSYLKNIETELGRFDIDLRFGAISPFQNGDPVNPNEEIQEHIYYVNNTISNLESTKYASYGNLEWWKNPATPLVPPKLN
jgi:hypothetical protein